MKRLMIVTALGLTTAMGAALAAKTAVASSPLPMPRPGIMDISFDDAAPGIEARMVLVSAIDPAAPTTPGYGVNDSERVVFPIYFAEGWTTPTGEAEAMLRAVAEEITYRGLQNITVQPSSAARLSPDFTAQAEAEDRVEAVAESLEKYGVPDRWIAVQPYPPSDI
ncbi:MAG: hypothetical protein RH982_05435 [Parvibaculum sp.]